MLKNILPLFILIFSIHTQAQIKQGTTDAIDKRIKDLISVDIPDEQLLDSMTKIKKECRHIGYNGGLIQTGRSMMLAYSNQGNTREVIKTANQIENLPAPKGYSMVLCDIHRIKGLALIQLGYDELSLKEFRASVAYAKKIKNPNFRHYKTALAYENITAYFENTNTPQDTTLHYLRKCIEEIKKIDEKPKDNFTIDYKYDMLCMINKNFGLFYMDIYKPQNLELAEKYLLASLKIYDNSKYNILPVSKIEVLNALGSLYYAKKNYKKTVIYLENALRLEKEYNNPMSRRDAYQILTKSYLELNNNNKSKEYLKLFTSLDDSLTFVEKASVGIPLKKIVADNNAAHDKAMQKTLLVIAGIFILLVAVSIFLWRRNNKKIHKNYNLLIEKLKLETAQPKESIDFGIADENQEANPEINTDPKEKPTYITGSTMNSLISNISDDTMNSLISKLEEFENSNEYVNKEISLVYLTNYLRTNIRYLSEIIKLHKGKSFNEYINGLRIDYITKLLYEEPKYRDYKMDYLAELCGFSSRQVFTVIFKKQTGISPSFFIDNLKKEMDMD